MLSSKEFVADCVNQGLTMKQAYQALADFAGVQWETAADMVNSVLDDEGMPSAPPGFQKALGRVSDLRYDLLEAKREGDVSTRSDLDWLALGILEVASESNFEDARSRIRSRLGKLVLAVLAEVRSDTANMAFRDETHPLLLTSGETDRGLQMVAGLVKQKYGLEEK